MRTKSGVSRHAACSYEHVHEDDTHAIRHHTRSKWTRWEKYYCSARGCSELTVLKASSDGQGLDYGNHVEHWWVHEMCVETIGTRWRQDTHWYSTSLECVVYASTLYCLGRYTLTSWKNKSRFLTYCTVLVL